MRRTDEGDALLKNGEKGYSSPPEFKDVSPDDVLNYTGFGPFQIMAFFLSGLTYFAYGCDISIFVFIGDKVMAHWNLTATEYAILPASTGITNVLGAFLFSFLADRFGRLWPYALCVSWMGFLSVASAFSNYFALLIVLRCLTSVAIGGIPGLVYPTIVEFLPVRNRGRVAVLNMLMGELGMCLNCGLAWWLIPAYPQLGWRYYIISCAVPTFIVALFRLCFHFESPRYLIARGRTEEAWRIFSWIARINGKELSGFVSKGGFMNTNLTVNSPVIAQRDRDKVRRRRSIFIQVFQIFTLDYLRLTIPLSIVTITESFGYLISQLFLPYFLQGLGVGIYFTLLVTILAQIPGVLLVSIIMEWPEVGRLNSFRFFAFLAAVFFLLLTLVQNSVTIPVFLVFIYFASGPILGLIYTYISESYPTAIRSVVTSYFYILQAVTYTAGAMGSSKLVGVAQHWLFPAIFTVAYFIQFCAALVLKYEPMSKKLKDVVK